MVNHGKYNVLRKYDNEWDYISNRPLILKEAKAIEKNLKRAGYIVKIEKVLPNLAL